LTREGEFSVRGILWWLEWSENNAQSMKGDWGRLVIRKESDEGGYSLEESQMARM